MTLAEFKHLTAVYGGDLDRWPPAERAMARTLLAESEQAGRILRDAGDVDRWLNAAPVVSDQQVERVFAAIQSRLDDAAPLPQVALVLRPSPAWWAATGSFLAAMGVVGYLAGEPGVGLRQGETQASIAELVAPSYLTTWR